MFYTLAIISFFAVVIAIAVVDAFTKSIYDWMLIVGSIISFALLILAGYSFVAILKGGALGFLLYGIIYGAAYLYYKREAFGFGDVLFNAYICGFLGAFGLFYGVIHSFLTFFVATAWILIVSIAKRKFSRDMELPLAPAMAVSGMITLYYYYEIIAFIFRQ